MKCIVIVKMVLLVIRLNELLPYKRILVRWPWGKFRISSFTAMAKLLSRVWRVVEYRGQRSRKCSIDSFSKEHLQRGSGQLTL